MWGISSLFPLSFTSPWFRVISSNTACFRLLNGYDKTIIISFPGLSVAIVIIIAILIGLVILGVGLVLIRRWIVCCWWCSSLDTFFLLQFVTCGLSPQAGDGCRERTTQWWKSRVISTRWTTKHLAFPAIMIQLPMVAMLCIPVIQWKATISEMRTIAHGSSSVMECHHKGALVHMVKVTITPMMPQAAITVVIWNISMKVQNLCAENSITLVKLCSIMNWIQIHRTIQIPRGSLSTHSAQLVIFVHDGTYLRLFQKDNFISLLCFHCISCHNLK